MKIDIRTANEIQYLFEYLYDEDYNALYLIPGDSSKLWGWQFTVEIIYRLYVCGLICIYPESILIKNDPYSYDGIDDFCNQLAKNNPCATEQDLVWYGSDFYLSTKAYFLMDEYFPNTGNNLWDKDLNTAFIERLESIFEQYGVPWDENNPRFPIQPQSESDLVN